MATWTRVTGIDHRRVVYWGYRLNLLQRVAITKTAGNYTWQIYTRTKTQGLWIPGPSGTMRTLAAAKRHGEAALRDL